MKDSGHKAKVIFTTGDIAKICHVACRTVSKWIDSGRLRGYRIPGSQDRRVPREALVAFLKENGMPMNGLESDGFFKTLVVGAATNFVGRLKELLPESEGFRHEAAQDGFDAGAVLHSIRPNAVIIDLLLGRTEGMVVAQKVLRVVPAAGANVIALASEDEADVEELIRFGFKDVYKKPFDIAVLADRIRRIAGEGTGGRFHTALD